MVNAAIILAAGHGVRLGKGKPKPIVDVGGFKLFQLPLISLMRVGVRKFYIVTQRRIISQISRYVAELGIRNYMIIINDETHRENGFSFYLGLKAAKEEVLFVSMSDHIYPPQVPEKILRNYRSDVDVLVAADADPIFVDIDEATKILTEGHRVLRIGKQLRDYNFVDAGLFLVSRKILPIVERFVRRNFIVRMSSIINYLVDMGRNVYVADITGFPWLDVDMPRELRRLVRGDAREILNEIIATANSMGVIE